MDAIFTKIVETVIGYSFSLMAEIAAPSPAPTLNSLANKWKLLVKPLKPLTKKRFFTKHIKAFYRIHDILVGDIAELHNKTLIPQLQSCHDIIFGAMDIRKPAIAFDHHVTRIFKEFVKGITYFKPEKIATHAAAGAREEPIYHRKRSCGTGLLSLKAKFQKPVSEGTASANRDRLRICYIERQIYNQIYQFVLTLQNIPHKLELDKTERLCDRLCGVSISVDVTFDKEVKLPNFVKITYSTTLDRKLTRIERLELCDTNHCETFAKNPNSGVVDCQKIQNGVYYTKRQTYAKEAPWMPKVQARTRPRIEPLDPSVTKYFASRALSS